MWHEKKWYMLFAVVAIGFGVWTFRIIHNKLTQQESNIIELEHDMPVISPDGQRVYVVLAGSRVTMGEATLANPYIDIQYDTPVPPTPTVVPTATAEVLMARLSHYYPNWGGTNCHPANWNGTECTALLTDGKQWQHWSYWEGWGTACPREFQLGTKFNVPNFGVYTCIDRGGAINILEEDGTFFLDLLTKDQPYISGGEVVRDKYSPAGSFLIEVQVVSD